MTDRTKDPPQNDDKLDQLRRLINEVAVSLIGEAPTEIQLQEIYVSLDGACLEQFRTRLQAKASQGKLLSLRLLPYLARDCAESKDQWLSSAGKRRVATHEDERTEQQRQESRQAENSFKMYYELEIERRVRTSWSDIGEAERLLRIEKYRKELAAEHHWPPGEGSFGRAHKRAITVE